MGLNTSVIVLNDALRAIEKDIHFGAKLARAIELIHKPLERDISSGCNANAASVIETHHSDFTSIIAFGGNYASVLARAYGPVHHTTESQVKLLEFLAEQLGYKISKKRK